MAASVSEVGGIVSEGGGVDGEEQQPLQRMFIYFYFVHWGSVGGSLGAH